ncbi:hypothetical protein [Streptomyces peucetius]|uniref:Uncharacterized protein n=1 Tax=Streptomyces peucetius TaxID=1950 RepID=A0ABY6HZS6_STRPE|nr:hypothetical protein [Streptomyces peucetius]UYQ60113.1 hypothetical protein OGH68_00525 [Streptomyces peucetius]
MPGRLYPLDVEAPVAALAIMAEEWQSEPAPSAPARTGTLCWRIPDFARPAGVHRAPLEQRDDPRLYPAPDFLAAGLQGTESHRFLTCEYLNGLDFLEDLGLISVTDDEVGVFWSFGAY